MISIELLYFVAMLATFIILLLVCKCNAGVSLMCSALVGGLLYAICSGNWFALNPRYYIEGATGYFDTILIIIAAMIFIGGAEACGALDYLSALLVKVFRRFPTVLLLSFMLILMLPGMLTGSSLSAIISCGTIVAPIMLKMGIPKQKVGAIVAFGAILGMIAPPINIPVMVICDVVDIPYTGFDLPLILLTVPMAVIVTLFLSRSFSFKKEEGAEPVKKNWLENSIILGVLAIAYIALLVLYLVNKELDVAKLYGSYLIIFGVILLIAAVIIIFGKPYSSLISKEKAEEIVNMGILKEQKWYVLTPIFTLIILYLLQSLLPTIVGLWGSPLIFIISFIPSIFVGRKPNPLKVVKTGIGKSVSAMSLLMGVGMFLEIMTLNGVRGFFVVNAITLPNTWQYVGITVAMPLFGGVSAFGSASILGGPFVLALSGNDIYVAATLSLVASIGEFLPPTAISATFASQIVGEKKYSKVTIAAVIPLLLILAYALVFLIQVAKFA